MKVSTFIRLPLHLPRFSRYTKRSEMHMCVSWHADAGSKRIGTTIFSNWKMSRRLQYLLRTQKAPSLHRLISSRSIDQRASSRTHMEVCSIDEIKFEKKKKKTDRLRLCIRTALHIFVNMSASQQHIQTVRVHVRTCGTVGCQGCIILRVKC